ncbi:uncharacterized protein BDW47DRAFT_98323, partial [Aspergillus candidus]
YFLFFILFLVQGFGQSLWHVTPHDDTRQVTTASCKLPPLESDQRNVSLTTFNLPLDAVPRIWLVGPRGKRLDGAAGRRARDERTGIVGVEG